MKLFLSILIYFSFIGIFFDPIIGGFALFLSIMLYKDYTPSKDKKFSFSSFILPLIFIFWINDE